MTDPLMELIARARQIPAIFDELKAVLGEAMIEWDDFPVVTLSKLETVGRVDFMAGLRLLEHPPEAYAAEPHVRSLIELMAHVAWITGFESQPPDVAGARRRALCFEMGLADATRRLADTIPRQFHDPVANPKDVNRRYREFARLHAETGCGCRGRRWHKAEESLLRIIDTSDALLAAQGRNPADNPYAVYRYLRLTASAMAHLGLADRMFKEVGPEVSDFVPADLRHRGSLLGWLVHSYTTTCLWMLEYERSGRVIEFRDVVNAILGDSRLPAALGDRWHEGSASDSSASVDT